MTKVGVDAWDYRRVSAQALGELISARPTDLAPLGAGPVDNNGAPRKARRRMHETVDDLLSLQDLLDRSAATGGAHLSSIITAERRLSAAELSSRLVGMRLLALATVTADGRPLVGPVDGIFYRGAFHFGSSPESVRFRHIRRRPQVSATHLPGEDLAVTVHGRAVPIDVGDAPQAGFRRALIDIYVPRYGQDWEAFLDAGVCYARIDADRMFTFHLEGAVPTDPGGDS